MLRALAWMLALAALAAVALWVPIAGKPLWERAGGDRALAFFKLTPAARPAKKAAARKQPAARPAEETLTQDDRNALDALVAGAH